jgi:hypothetical protein
VREGILGSGDALPPTQLAAGLIASPPSEAVRERDVSAPIMHRRLRSPYGFRCFHGGAGSARSPHRPPVWMRCVRRMWRQTRRARTPQKPLGGRGTHWHMHPPPAHVAAR